MPLGGPDAGIICKQEHVGYEVTCNQKCCREHSCVDHQKQIALLNRFEHQLAKPWPAKHSSTTSEALISVPSKKPNREMRGFAAAGSACRNNTRRNGMPCPRAAEIKGVLRTSTRLVRTWESNRGNRPAARHTAGRKTCRAMSFTSPQVLVPADSSELRPPVGKYPVRTAKTSNNSPNTSSGVASNTATAPLVNQSTQLSGRAAAHAPSGSAINQASSVAAPVSTSVFPALDSTIGRAGLL